MPIEPVKIPQNVYIEDRIVGPLTLRQILIVAAGGGFSYALWASLSKTYGNIGLFLTVLVWLPAAVSVLFAFVKVNDLSMMKLLFLFLERMQKPTTRTWAPRQGIAINIRTMHLAETQKRPAEAPKPAEHLEELSGILDTQIGHTDTTKAEQQHLEEPTLELNQEPQAPRPVIPERIKAEAPDQSAHSSIFRDLYSA